MVVGQVDLDPVRALGHGCVELCLLEHGAAVVSADGATRTSILSHHGNFVACGRPGSQTHCVAAAGWAPIVRRPRPRRRPLDPRGETPRRPARGRRRDPRLRRRDRPEPLGSGFEAIAEVYCADKTVPRDVLRAVEAIPEVVSALTVSGEPDAVLRAAGRGHRAPRARDRGAAAPPDDRAHADDARPLGPPGPPDGAPRVARRHRGRRRVRAADDRRRAAVRFLLVPEGGDDPHGACAATGDGVWFVDPVDVPEAMERAAALGAPAGVIQLLDRHNRDCAAIAARLGVPHLKVPDAVPGSPFEVVRVLDVPGWHEAALWWPEHRVLVVAELIGTNAALPARRRAAPACTRSCARCRPARCAATSPSTCWSGTAAACTGRRPRRRSSRPTRARAATCRGSPSAVPQARRGRDQGR